MNQATIDKLRMNPHYKGIPNQPDPEDVVEEVKTYGVIPKHPTNPKTKIYKKKELIENQIV